MGRYNPDNYDDGIPWWAKALALGFFTALLYGLLKWVG